MDVLYSTIVYINYNIVCAVSFSIVWASKWTLEGLYGMSGCMVYVKSYPHLCDAESAILI